MNRQREVGEEAWYGRTRLIAGAALAMAMIIPLAFAGVVVQLVVNNEILAFFSLTPTVTIRIDYVTIVLIYGLLAFSMFFRNRYRFAITVVAALVLVISLAGSIAYLNKIWTNFV